MKEELVRAQENYKKAVDQKRKEQPTFHPGDSVWLLRKNIRTKRPSGKLDYKKIGPFKISKQINPVSYQLQLPPTLRIHDVFHVSLLEPHTPSTIPGRETPPAPPIDIQGTPEFEVSQILDSRLTKKGKKHYLVSWKGYGPSEATWEPEENLVHYARRLQEFRQRHPHKP
jgi:hypothetical protein